MANQNGTATEARGEGRDVSKIVERARTQVEDVTDRAKDAVETLDRRLATAMQENPMLVLGVAVGVGYVIGRVFSKIS